MAGEDLLSTAEVAHRLGVKPATVYAYVSRGLLERDPASSHRASRFRADAVDRLAHRSRHPNRSGALEVTVETGLTLLDPAGRLYYRGHDVIELARYRSFEDVVGLLWDGPTPSPWELDPPGGAQIAGLARLTPADASPFDLIPHAVAALATSDAGRGDRRPAAVRRTGARIFAGVLGLLAPDAATADRSAARRLWAAFSARRPRPAEVATLNAALICLADHELAASTLAARVAASAWADPYRVVLAGLGPIGGSLHGGAALEVAELLARVASPADAFATLEGYVSAGANATTGAYRTGGANLAAGGVPGFGHRVYRDRDPRADHLLGRLEAVASVPGSVARTRSVLEAAATLGVPAPNVDFALAALLAAMDLPPTAGPTIFAVARIAGLLAHALEEYPHRLRFRPRATYVGPAPPA
jgi:citrate synthase